VTLAATLAAFPALPVAGLALLIGIDRFMSEARAITNLIGNGLAAVVVARWDGALNIRRMNRVLNGETPQEADEPEEVLVSEARPMRT
jgi:aerobic C4-dicarboxylate transport protein